MKVAIITAGFLPIPATRGGAVENLVENLLVENEKNKNVKFEIFSIYDDKAILESKKYSYSNFIFIKVNFIVKIMDKLMFFIAKNILKKSNSHSYRFIFQRLSYLYQCSKYLKKYNYDKVVLENHPTEYFALKWHKNYIKYSDRYYYHCHNEFPSTYGCDSIIKNTKKIICVSEFRKNNVMEYLNAESTMFSVLKNGINTTMFDKNVSQEEIEFLKNKYSISKNDKILIFTGRIVPGKGIEETILAIKKLNRDDIKLLIIGASLNQLKTKTQFERKIETLVDNNIIFTGFVNYNEIYKYYKMADIAVLPSTLEDSAPLTVIEALVCGLPVISTISGGIPEYAQSGSSILIEKDKNLIDNLANEIENLIDDPFKIKEMSKSARKVSKDFTKEKFYDDFCKQILS